MNKEIMTLFSDYSIKAKELRLARLQAQLNFDNTPIESENQRKINENKLQKAKTEEANFRELYAKEIFTYFEKKKPMLIHRKSNKKYAWQEAFGNDYSQVSPELKHSLIALIEDDGGQFRLAKSFLNIFYY